MWNARKAPPSAGAFRLTEIVPRSTSPAWLANSESLPFSTGSRTWPASTTGARPTSASHWLSVSSENSSDAKNSSPVSVKPSQLSSSPLHVSSVGSGAVHSHSCKKHVRIPGQTPNGDSV